MAASASTGGRTRAPKPSANTFEDAPARFAVSNKSPAACPSFKTLRGRLVTMSVSRSRVGARIDLTAPFYHSGRHAVPSGEALRLCQDRLRCDSRPRAADAACVGEDPLLRPNNASTSGSRTLRSPAQRKKTFKSVEGAAQSPRKRGEGPRKTSQTPKERWTAAEHDALLRGEYLP